MQVRRFSFPLNTKIKEGYVEAKENARCSAPHSSIPCRSLSTRCTQSSSGYTKSWTCHQLVMQRVSSESPFYCWVQHCKGNQTIIHPQPHPKQENSSNHLPGCSTPSSPLSIDQHRSIPGDSVTQNHSCNLVSLTLVPPEDFLLLPAVNYLCCYTPSRKLFQPVNKGVGPHLFSLLPFYAMRVFGQTGSLCMT